MAKMLQHELNEETILKVSQIFKALGDPTRIRILNLICCQEYAVNDIAEQLGMNQSAVSHQLRLLKNMRIVKFRREGTTMYYSCDDEHVIQLLHQTIEHAKHGS